MTAPAPSDKTVMIVYGPELASYDFSDDHPLQPSRYELTMSLLSDLGWLDVPSVVVETPRPAEISELQSVHSQPYIQAVIRAQEIARGLHPPMDLTTYGLGTEDDPIFEAIHDAPLLCVGATVQAINAVMEARATHAYNPAGGLHHAMRSRASGFCVYNDCAVAMSKAANAGYRLAYVDLDAHHGDGVQAAFYDDPRVLTISIHESGYYLFPGTGDIRETGTGEGRGTCINIPLPAYSGNEAYLQVMERVIVPAVRSFAPDILVAQTGCDTHHADPLTDLAATLPLYPLLAKQLHDLAHECCEGRWLIVGGGGYDPADVTPRAWSALIGTVLGRDPNEAELPATWIRASRAEGGDPPRYLLQDPGPCCDLLPTGDVSRLLRQIESTALAELLRRNTLA